MLIQELRIEHFRNLRHVELGLSPGVNVFTGSNGSGKTSLLEAIYVLSRGRSFRTHRLAGAIEMGQDHFLVFARVLASEASGELLAAGYEFHRVNGPMARFRGEPVKRLSDLATLIPVVYFGAQTTQLLAAPPQERRSWLDWGVFHVEHGFLPVYQRYERALRQCNAALRAGATRAMVSPWYRELAEAGMVLNQLRRAWLDHLIPLFRAQAERMASFPLQSLDLRFEPGWSGEEDQLLEILEAGFARDAEHGFVHRGPHRADLALSWAGRLAKDYASAGQLKLLTAALTLASIDQIRERAGQTVPVLLDDLPAELDDRHRDKVLSALGEQGHQVLVTATDIGLLGAAFSPASTFHVEQGRIATV